MGVALRNPSGLGKLSLLAGGLLVSVAMVAGACQAQNLIPDDDDDDGGSAAWTATANLLLEIDDGEICTDVPGGTVNPWDAIIMLDGMPLVRAEGYRFAFEAEAEAVGAGDDDDDDDDGDGTVTGPVRALVQMPVAPWTSYVEILETVGSDEMRYAAEFASPVTRDDAQIAFQIGGSAEPWRLCLEDIEFVAGIPIEFYTAETGPTVRVNQLGYLPDGPKRATIVTDAATPLAWTVLDSAGIGVASGMTTPRGYDASAGVNIHTADFSALAATGDGFTLTVEGEPASYPFSIRSDLYDPLRIDALSYYYPVRSGIEIDGAIAGAAYARPAGHVSVAGGPGPNQGDWAVPCQPPEVSQQVYGEPWTCAYMLDVVGGWYDAGDHGKYVVNGGISAAQLMATWERALLLGAEAEAALGDGSLPVPEAGNGVPDILDEVRWELEWMLTMVVPAGDPLVGLVHHKIHDNEWTGLPLMPHLDPKIRELHRPSTAATLNLAAVAAQGSRLFRPYDPGFADGLLAAARSAYQAAQGTPALYATPEDGASGGGPYDDTDVADEFYWAAAELFITTGEAQYLTDLRASPHWDGPTFVPYAFDWKYVSGFARVQLATVPSALPASDLAAIRASVAAGADGFLALQAGQHFGHPYAPESGLYDWGSTHLVVQNALVLAAAHELTGDDRYRDGALEAMDYVLGRNALNISYITGYGTVFAENQHSRWFAAQVDSSLPHPPNGALSGGPNSSIQDPVVQNLFGIQGCAPQICYIDDINSWATNEITINWNAALSQMASFLADQ